MEHGELCIVDLSVTTVLYYLWSAKQIDLILYYIIIMNVCIDWRYTSPTEINIIIRLTEVSLSDATDVFIIYIQSYLIVTAIMFLLFLLIKPFVYFQVRQVPVQTQFFTSDLRCKVKPASKTIYYLNIRNISL